MILLGRWGKSIEILDNFVPRLLIGGSILRYQVIRLLECPKGGKRNAHAHTKGFMMVMKRFEKILVLWTCLPTEGKSHAHTFKKIKLSSGFHLLN